jgi:hypothetical protein
MEITLEEAFSGKTAQIRVPSSITCETCSGSGAKPAPAEDLRHLPRPRQGARQPGLLLHRAHLPDLPGPRPDDPTPAPSAAARAASPRSVRCRSTFPPASRTARASGSPGEGEAGLRGGPPGDLYIFLSVKPHEFFQRDGADLYCKVPISMTTAALGGSSRCRRSTARRRASRFPRAPRTASSSASRARACRCCARSVGDLYIQVAVETPQNLTKRQRELLEEFEKLSSKENSPQSSGFFSRMKDFFEKMASVIDPDSGLPVLELGPGTGVITRPSWPRGVKPENLYASNIPPEFVTHLRANLPGVNVIDGDAFNLDDTLGLRRGHAFRFVISGVPLLNFPVAQRIRYIEDLLDRIPPAGRSCS